mgnify:CR=1 FL=1
MPQELRRPGFNPSWGSDAAERGDERRALVAEGALAGSAAYLDRVEVLITEMLRDEGVRLPGARREALRRRAEIDGIEIPEALLAQWRAAGAA